MPSTQFFIGRKPVNDLNLYIETRWKRSSQLPGRRIHPRFMKRQTYTLEKVGSENRFRPIRYPSGLNPRQKYAWASVRFSVAVWGVHNP